MSSARSVAKELVRLSAAGAPLTRERLGLLLVLSQAWSLVLRDSDLFPEDIECAADGPAIARLGTSMDFDDAHGLHTEDEGQFLGALWADFGNRPEADLRVLILSHPGYRASLGGPWAMDAQDNPVAGTVPPPALAAYLCHREEEERAAVAALAALPPLDRSLWDGSLSRTPHATKPRGA